MAIEIVDFPSYKMVIFHSYVKLPEGIQKWGLKSSEHSQPAPWLGTVQIGPLTSVTGRSNWGRNLYHKPCAEDIWYPDPVKCWVFIQGMQD